MLKYSVKASGSRIEYGFLGKQDLILEKGGCNNVSNRLLVSKVIDKKFSDVIFVEQKHTNICHEGNDFSKNGLVGDALVARKKNLPLIVRTADCVPIIFFDKETLVIGIAHAGWRGAFGGVIRSTVERMLNFGANAKHIDCVIGPCIKQESYEVSKDFHDDFIEQDRVNKKFFVSSKNKDHFMFDLPGYCSGEIKKLGIQNIKDVYSDTFTSEDIWYSHRRSTKNGYKRAGDNISYIVIKNED
ncbi:MAG: peptidoglycan editing factor PgeF [Rickettsiales bacterium]